MLLLQANLTADQKLLQAAPWKGVFWHSTAEYTNLYSKLLQAVHQLMSLQAVLHQLRSLKAVVHQDTNTDVT